jgi:branched-chain amino acid transport system permease protein
MRHLLAGVAAPASITVRVLLGTLLLTLVLVAAAFIGLSTFDSAMLVAMLINVVVVVGLGTFMGNAGIVSFGHAAFMAIAAYVSGLASMDPVSRSAIMPTFPHELDGFSLPFGAGIVLALVLVAVFAALSGSAIVRLRADSAAIATLGVLVIVNVVLLNARSLTNGAQPLYGVSLRTTWQWAFVAAVVAIAISRWYRESNLGLQLRASREDEIAAQALGVNVRTRRLEAWILSAVLAGLGGVLLGHFLGAFSPSQFYLTYTVTIVAMLIVGGGGTVTGAVL